MAYVSGLIGGMAHRARNLTVALLAGTIAAITVAAPAGAGEARHGISMYGDLKYGPDFSHFDYANPDAPKGGDLRLAASGTFDKLNPFTLKGVPAAGLGYLFDTLSQQALDEPFSEYGLLAESMAIADDRSTVTFRLREQARFHDGSPVTAEDVAFTFRTLKTKGHPQYRFYYAEVDRAEVLDRLTIRFHFTNAKNRELPLILGQLPVLSKDYYETRDFEDSSLEPPMGSGPYKVATVDGGRTITYQRDPDYWGRDLPVNRGIYNFDRIRYDYYRDANIAVEAFKAGNYDFRLENVSRLWATAYKVPAINSGAMVKEEIPHQIPTGLQGFIFNLRQPVFRDRAFRHALQYVFDFEWTNKTLFYGQYTRTQSYFSNSELASSDVPEGLELEILDQFRDQLPPELFTRPFTVPETDGTGTNRGGLKKAYEILTEAGYRIVDNRLISPLTGEPIEIEFLTADPAMERIALPFTRSMKRLGIEASLRTVDSSQYENRMQTFDFDMTTTVWGQSMSPGNEQREYWGSKAADRDGSRNLIGIKDPVVDALVDKIVSAPDRETLVASVRALDRVLLWGYYVVPHFHIQSFRTVYWNKFNRPETPPKYGLGLQTWWYDAGKSAAHGLD